MRKILTSILMVLALLLGGVGAAASASAELRSPSTTVVTAEAAPVVHTVFASNPPFYAEPMVVGTQVFLRSDSVDPSWLKTTNTAGITRNQLQGTAVMDVYRTCANSLASKIQYSNPAGNTGTLAAGQCLVPTMRGQYAIRLISS